jgi:hypothetical protein
MLDNCGKKCGKGISFRDLVSKLSSIIVVLKRIPPVHKMECLFDDYTYRKCITNHDFR